MSAPEQVIAGGTTGTAASLVVGWVAQATPIVQFLSYTTGLVVGVLTAIYTYHKIQEIRKRRAGSS